MRHVAFVTCQQHPGLSASDALVVAPLRERGVSVQAMPWDAAVAWQRFDGVVLRSNWDYPQRPEAFRVWLAQLQALRINLWNPPEAVQWNIDKRYLKDLQAHGVVIIPTVWLDPGQRVSLAALLAARGWEQAVIKPRIGASARHIWETSQTCALAHQSQLDACLARQGWMVQKLMPQIAAGEWSLVFFRQTFAYATLKHPAPDSIFVQPRLGGHWHRQHPDPSLIAQASHVLEMAQRHTAVPEPFLYARVDGLVVDGTLYVME